MQGRLPLHFTSYFFFKRSSILVNDRTNENDKKMSHITEKKTISHCFKILFLLL